ncbi:MAG TPA: hypothetical protein PKN32_02435 [Bacteroidales bacterium]|nr:hypothetical protein [Bacteroidales bacterium]
MKNFKPILIGFIFLTLTNTLFSQDFETVLEQTWYGGSQSRTDVTESGYFSCTEKLYDIIYDDYSDSFTGKSHASFVFDGVTYNCKCYIKGKVNTSENKVVITTTSVISSDYLPYGMYWTQPTIYLTIFEDEDHRGEYIMYGQTSGQYYDDEYVAYATYKYY